MIGFPSKATPEKGKAVLTKLVEGFAEHLRVLDV